MKSSPTKLTFNERVFAAMIKRNIDVTQILGTDIVTLEYMGHRELWINGYSRLVPFNIGLIYRDKQFVQELLSYHNIAFVTKNEPIGIKFRVVYSDTGFISLCRWDDHASYWEDVSGENIKLWRKFGAGILSSMPGLRIVGFVCIEEAVQKKKVVLNILTSIQEFELCAFIKNNRKISYEELIIDMLFPESTTVDKDTVL